VVPPQVKRNHPVVNIIARNTDGVQVLFVLSKVSARMTSIPVFNGNYSPIPPGLQQREGFLNTEDRGCIHDVPG
jgi:hypothetical protein